MSLFPLFSCHHVLKGGLARDVQYGVIGTLFLSDISDWEMEGADRLLLWLVEKKLLIVCGGG